MKAIFLTLLLVIPTVALAADPECVDPAIYDPASGVYDATDTIRFCTPEKDANDVPLQDGDLTRCVVTAAGTPFAITSSNRPAQGVVFRTPDSVKEAVAVGELSVHCETSGGTGEAAVASARFRPVAAPGTPILLR
jgi:hypothetical protein